MNQTSDCREVTGKMRNRKWMSTGLAALVAVPLALVGCGGKGSGNQSEGTVSPTASTAPSAAVNKDPIKLTMWGGVPPESGPQAVVAVV